MESTFRQPQWKELYQQALLETDLKKLPALIGDAHKAILDRIEQTLSKPNSVEHQELNDALGRLRSLRQEVNAWISKPEEDGSRLSKTG